MVRDPAELCFDILLSKVLDFSSFEDLLLCAMPVCRSWRAHVIDHRRYWGSLLLTYDDGPLRGLRSSESLFLLRLSRTRDRPCHVDVWLRDGHVLIPALAEHLPHIRSLRLFGKPSEAKVIFEAFRAYPAPLLRALSLTFIGGAFSFSSGEEPISDLTPMPRDMFRSQAPALVNVELHNVPLQTGSDFPSCLSNALYIDLLYSPNSLLEAVTMPHRVLPDISVHLPRLEELGLDRDLALESPAFWRADTWRHVRALTFGSFNLWDGRTLAELPVHAVSRIRLRCRMVTDPDDIIRFAATISGPLDVMIPWGSVSPRPTHLLLDTALQWRMTAPGERVERWVHSYLPKAGSPACALQQAPLADRIVKLSISLADWDILVSRGYLTAFPALETLILALVTDPSNSFWRKDDGAEPLRLSCPRLRHLALTHECTGRFPQAMDIASIAAFVLKSLPGAQLPLVLELKEVDIDGQYAERSDVFSSVFRSPRDPRDNAGWG